VTLPLILAAALVGCGGGAREQQQDVASIEAPSNAPTPTDTTSVTSPSVPGPHALIIGLDGVTYGAVRAGMADGTLPNIAKLKVSLAYSGGTPGEQTQQANLPTPGWATLLSGNWANLHHVTSDVSAQAIQGGSVFDALRSKGTGLNGAVLASSNIASLLATQRDAGALDALIDCSNDALADDCVTRQALSLIDKSYGTVVAQYHAATNVAQSKGTGSSAYAKTVRNLDQVIGTLLSEIARKPDERWLVILTSAHGLSIAGGTDGLPLVPESTTFIGLNQDFNDTSGIGAAAPATVDELRAYPSIADVTPMVLSHFSATPAVQAYGMYGSQLIGTPPVSNLSVGVNTTNANSANLQATLDWIAPAGDKPIYVLRDGQVVASLPARTTSYIDYGLRAYILGRYSTGGTSTVRYTVQVGETGAARSVQTMPLSYTPMLASLADGLYVYYPFSSTLPAVDVKGSSTLAPSASDLDAKVGTIVTGPFGDGSYGLKVDLNYTDANKYEGYALTFNSPTLDPTYTTDAATAPPVFTVGYWFQYPTAACITSGDFVAIGNKNFGSGGNPGFAMAVYSASSGTGCTLRTNASDGSSRVDYGAGSASNQQWAYAISVIDGRSRKITAYVWDPVLGLRQGTLALTSQNLAKLYTGPGATCGDANKCGAAFASWGLGTDGSRRYRVTGNGNQPYGGTSTNYALAFSDLAIWNRALTAAEIASIYQSGMPISSVLPQ